MRRASIIVLLLLVAVLDQAAHSVTIDTSSPDTSPPPPPSTCVVTPPTIPPGPITPAANPENVVARIDPVVSVVAQTGPITPNLDRSVWVATESAVARIDPALNAVAQTVGLQGVKALTVDARSGNVWAATQSAYYLLAPNGAELQRLDVAALSLEKIKRLAVNPYDNSVWLASESRLAHVSVAGQLLSAFAIPTESKALSLATDETVWVTTSSKLSHYSPAGQLLAERNLSDFGFKEAKFLSVDSIGGIVLLASETKAIALRVADLGMATSISFDQELEDFDVDIRTGNFWLCSQIMLVAHLVSHFDVDTVCHGVCAPVHAGGGNEKAGVETNHCRVAATDARSAQECGG